MGCNNAEPEPRTMPYFDLENGRAWREQSIHTVANEIVTEAIEHDCDVIVFEELTDIRERLPHTEWHHVWAFRRLVEYVEYEAPEQGVAVEQVDPNHTSQRCSHIDCGFTHEGNRDGEQFNCQTYGYEINADYNGAKNIGLYRRTERLILSAGDTSPVESIEASVRRYTIHAEATAQTAFLAHVGGTQAHQ